VPDIAPSAQIGPAFGRAFRIFPFAPCPAISRCS
jgi:hypothetical protein